MTIFCQVLSYITNQATRLKAGSKKQFGFDHGLRIICICCLLWMSEDAVEITVNEISRAIRSSRIVSGKLIETQVCSHYFGLLFYASLYNLMCNAEPR